MIASSASARHAPRPQTAAKKAGGGVSRSGRITSGNRSRFGHGKLASIQANRFIGVIPGKPAQEREL